MASTSSPGRARSRAALVGLLVLVSVAAAACSGGSGPAAVTVNGETLSQSSVDRELAAIRSNPQLQAQTTAPDAHSVIDATWLTAVVETEVAAQEVKRAHVRITADDRTAAQTWADGYFGDPSVFAAFPKWFRDAVLARYANVPAIVRKHAKPPTDADVQADYEQSLAQNCPSGRLVSHILVTTEQAAQSIEQQLAAGANFAQLATKQSTDTGSAPRGGALGCIDNQQLDPTFTAAANATPIGKVSAPVHTQFGWHVIRVDNVRTAVPLASVANEIRVDLVEQSPQGMQALVKTMAAAKVKVASRYGKWVVRNGQGQVEPRTPATSSTTATTGPTGTTAPGATTSAPSTTTTTK
jgi:parvulin-like peptidyl-prolyl isomerase